MTFSAKLEDRMKGRKPTPVRVKNLNGNPGKRTIHTEAVAGGPALRRPPWMTGKARAMWERVTKAWAKSGVLQSVDQAVLEAFCSAYGRFVDAEAHIAEWGITLKGNRGIIKNPAVTVLNEAVTQMRSLGAEMGLTPAARARLAAPAGEGRDDFDLYMANAG